MSRHGGPTTIYRHASTANVRTDSNSGAMEGTTTKRRRAKHTKVPEYRLPVSPSVEELSWTTKDISRGFGRSPDLNQTQASGTIPRPRAQADYVQPVDRTSKYSVGSIRTSTRAPRMTPVKVTVASLRDAAHTVSSPPRRISGAPAPNKAPSFVKALPHSPVVPSDSDARFEAFLSRTGLTANAPRTPVDGLKQTKAERRRSQSLNGLQTRSAAAATDAERSRQTGLDRDFLAQFAKEHDFAPELADEICRELSLDNSPGQTAVTTLKPASAQLPAPAPEKPTRPALSHLSPKPKPPRPPRSERRVSHSPGAPVVPATAKAAVPAAFQDADEEPAVSRAPFSEDSSNRDSADSGTKQRRDFSQPTQGDSNLRSVEASRDRDSFEKPLSSYPAHDEHGSPELDHYYMPDGYHEIARAIAVEEQVQAREDYERDRRLSSLFKGLGIHGMVSPSVSPIMQEQEAEEEGDGEGNMSEPTNVATALNTGADDYFTSQQNDPYLANTQSYDSYRERSAYEQETVSRSSAYGNSHQYQSQSRASPPLPTRKSSRRVPPRRSSLRRSTERVPQPRSMPKPMDRNSNTQDVSRESQGATESVLASILANLDPAQRASIVMADQRASLGISDSVLASILASESFCLPQGSRLSIDRIAARLSTEISKAVNRKSQERQSGYSIRTPQRHDEIAPVQIYQQRDEEPVGHGPNVDYDEPHTRDDELYVRRAVASDIEDCGDEYQQSRGRWTPSPNDILQQDGGLDCSHVEEMTFGSIYPDESSERFSKVGWQDNPELEDATENERNPFYQSVPGPAEQVSAKATPRPELPVQPSSEQAATVPPPLLALEKPAAPTQSRKRTLSFNYLAKLGSSLSGSKASSSSCSTKSQRRRMPSIFAGLSSKVSASGGSDADVTSIRAASPAPSIASLLPAAPLSKGRKRALTGPARLIDIANAVTNSPSFSQLPTLGDALQGSMQPAAAPAATWRSTIPEAMLGELIKVHSRTELHRQEVIWELCQTEASFVNGLKGVVQVFSLPLRTHQGAWIAGVPISVSRLFDWLDDIVYLHSHLATALQRWRASQGVLTMRIAEAFLSFIPRLEVHQPYLVCFEQVTQEIEDMSAQPDSEFGEFVRMQQALPECGAMTLSSFLLKPVQRLMKYPLFFKQLCNLTPTSHPDHEATVQLFQRTDLLIRMMQEVKVREEEYEHILSLSRKIHGLPTGMILARRDRRLLASGPLKRVLFTEKDRQLLEAELASSMSEADQNAARSERASESLGRGASPGADSGVFVSPRPYSTLSAASSSGSSAGADYFSGRKHAMSPAAASVTSGTTRPNSINSSLRSESVISYSSGLSEHSLATASSASTLHPNYQQNLHYQTHSQQTASRAGLLPASATAARLARVKAKESPIHIFVFSDLVVFATKHAEGLRNGLIKTSRSSSSVRSAGSQSGGSAMRPEKGAKYRVVEEWGVSKIMGVTDLSGKTEHDNLLQVDLLPVWSEKEITQSSLWNAAMATSIYLSVPNPSSSSSSSSARGGNHARDTRKKDEEFSYYLSALEQSYLSALESLSFPSDEELDPMPRRLNPAARPSTSSNRIGARDGHPAKEETHLPRSPSEQGALRRASAITSGLEEVVSAEDEREERAWWRGRLEKVRKESQACDHGQFLSSPFLGASSPSMNALSPDLQLGGHGERERAEQLRLAEEKKRAALSQANRQLERKLSSNSLRIGLAISYDDEDHLDAYPHPHESRAGASGQPRSNPTPSRRKY